MGMGVCAPGPSGSPSLQGVSRQPPPSPGAPGLLIAARVTAYAKTVADFGAWESGVRPRACYGGLTCQCCSGVNGWLSRYIVNEYLTRFRPILTWVGASRNAPRMSSQT